MPDLSGLREGDEIAILNGRSVPTIRRVAKIHKHYLVDGCGWKWRLDSGAESPRISNEWGGRPWAEPATDVHRTLIENAKTRDACRRLLCELAPRAARDTNLAARILEALKPIVEEEEKDA